MNNIRFASIGLGTIVQTNRVVAVISPGTVTASSYLSRAKNLGMFIDSSRGRKMRAILIMDDGTVVASAISVQTLLNRFMDDPADLMKQPSIEEDFMFEEEQDGEEEG